MLFFCVLSIYLSLTAASEQCATKNYQKIGCYNRNPTLLPANVLTAREAGKENSAKALIDWENFGTHLKSFACECSEKIKDDYKYFAIGFYGECFAGNDTAALEEMLKNTNAAVDCLSGDQYESCNSNDDKECTGVANSEYIYQLAASAPIVVDGGYSDFSDWTECDRTCGDGKKVRERSCTNPIPSNDGKGCSELGESTESQTCKISECPVNGEWSDYGSYGACSMTCGDGQKTKTRKCNNPSSANGGDDCVGSATKTTSCKLQNCPAYTAYHANHVCEGGSIRLYCPANWVIKFNGGSYFYGRNNKETCKENKQWYDSLNNCGQTSKNKKIYDTCQDKNECTVKATNNWFGGDPCTKNPKYIYVNFRCYGYDLL